MLHVSQIDRGRAERFNSSHVVHVPLGDCRHLITLSGIVTLDYKSAQQAKAHSQNSGWAEEDLQLDLLLPPELMAGGQRLRLEQCAPLLTINAIGGVSTVGWAVNSCQGPGPIELSQILPIRAVIGVYNTGEVLHAIGYYVTLTGQFVTP
jgi:hypothetical protein